MMMNNIPPDFNGDIKTSTFQTQQSKPEGLNMYMLSILDPAQTASIPDLNYTATVEKQVLAQMDFTAGAAPFILWQPFHLMDPTVYVLIFDSLTGIYYPFTTIPFDVVLGDDFLKARLVSGSLCAQSATVTGNAFTVSGSAIAVSYQALPPFHHAPPNVAKVSFQNLTASARNPMCKQPITPVFKGVVVLAHPEGLNQFYPTLNSTVPAIQSGVAGGVVGGSSDTSTRFVSASANGVQLYSNGWNLGAVAPMATTVVFDSEQAAALNGTSFIPPNAHGRIHMDVNLAYIAATVAGGAVAKVIVRTGRCSNVNGSVVYTDHTFEYAVAVSTTSNNLSASLEMDADANSPAGLEWIEYITVSVQSFSAGTITFSGDYQNSIVVEWVALGERYSSGPGALIAIEGVSAGQVLAISSTVNVQAVPGPNLARNVSTATTPIGSLSDLLIANHIVAFAPDLGLKFAYSLPEYLALREHFPRMSERRNMRAMSAGLMDGLRGFWRNFLAPILKGISPFVGGILGGPAGAALGTAVSGLVPSYQRGMSAALWKPGDLVQCDLYKDTDRVGHLEPLQRALGAPLSVPLWSCTLTQAAEFVADLARGGMVTLTGAARLACFNPVTRTWDHTKYAECKMKLEQAGAASLILLRSVGGTFYVSASLHYDVHTRITTLVDSSSKGLRADAIAAAVQLDQQDVCSILADLVAVGVLSVDSSLFYTTNRK
jgi:hypothetical protein